MNPSIRELTPSELSALYLPLRWSVLHSELGWSRLQDPLPEFFRDAFDATAIQFGCFIGAQFAGALRLIVRPEAGELPSAPYLPNHGDYSGRSAELSRGLIDPAYRGNKLFHLLVRACLDRARAEGVRHLIVSSSDTTEVREFYKRFGLVSIGTPFGYSDEAIEVPGLSILLHSRLG